MEPKNASEEQLELKDKINTIRRRITDKMCKNPEFLKSIVGFTIEEGLIKHSDLLTTDEIREILNAPKSTKSH